MTNFKTKMKFSTTEMEIEKSDLGIDFINSRHIRIRKSSKY